MTSRPRVIRRPHRAARMALVVVLGFVLAAVLSACGPTPTNSNHSGPGHENSTTSTIKSND